MGLPTGRCALCLRNNVELQQSHLLPAGTYRLQRGDPSRPGNPNPLQISTGKAVQTSYQQRANLLCFECEQRFNRKGENWIFANCIQRAMPDSQPFPINSETFPFLAELYKTQPLIPIANAVSVYSTSHLAQAREALVYFAASMVWRGSVFPWNEDGSYPVRLGRYAEELRLFLMDEKPFPEEASLAVTVRAPSIIWKHTHAPVTKKQDGAFVHHFVIPGFGFSLYTGWNLPEWAGALDLVHDPRGPVFVGIFIEDGIGQHASRIFHTSGGLQGLRNRGSKRSRRSADGS
jgi:hypothetical protein